MMPISEHHVIIGTAGHVDHGKTALIGALTGVETDRLKEEKARGISIDLGFAPFRLPDGTIAGVVDVPGHEKFINNMLAGIGGIDLVLLVVDVNEGVMPQTREHLQILKLLEIPRGIVVLTKCDLADRDLIDLVEEDLREETAGTFLAAAPFCRVSAITGAGIQELVKTIQQEIAALPVKDSSGPMRLPVDRHFSVTGFGTVITGTLLSGTVKLGDSVEVLPVERIVRVREIQVHGKKVEQACAGQRVALNLVGLDREDVPRGSVVGTPGVFEQTSRFDARLTLLEDAPRPLRFRDPVHVCLGTSRVVGLVALLDRDKLQPGESVLAQVHLERPLVAHRLDRFIIRSYSPVTTIGGGMVVDPQPLKHKRFRAEVLQALQELESGEKSFLLQKLASAGCARVKELALASGLSQERIRDHLEKLQTDGQVDQLAEQWLPVENLNLWRSRLLETVDRFHAEQPLQTGIPRATLKGALPRLLSPKSFDALLGLEVASAGLELHGDCVARPGFQKRIDPAQAQRLEQLADAYRSAGTQAKNRREMLGGLGIAESAAEPLLRHLFDEGTLVKLTEETFFHRDVYQLALTALIQHFSDNETLSLAEFRDLIGSSRKQVQALLEHWDKLKYTLRRDEVRVAWKLPRD
jgi:selenocysteine-specific elongation factor